jgi:hypothetical protein
MFKVVEMDSGILCGCCLCRIVKTLSVKMVFRPWKGWAPCYSNITNYPYLKEPQNVSEAWLACLLLIACRIDCQLVHSKIFRQNGRGSLEILIAKV